MRHILRRHELEADGWRYLGEETAEDEPLILPWAQLGAARARWLARTGPLGVRLLPTDRVEELAPVLPRLSLVAVVTMVC